MSVASSASPLSFCTVYIPSYNNSDAVAASVASCPDGVPIVIADNASDEAHQARLQALTERCRVVAHPANIGRVENWAWCVRDFVQGADAGGPAWLKWLFAGDTLTPGAVETLRDAAASFPDARLIVAAHEMVDAGGKIKPWNAFPGPARLLPPADALRLAATNGNWFGPPLGHCVHADAVRDGFDFGDLPWAADFRFCVGVAARFPVLYLPASVGQFQQAHRRYFAAHTGSIRAALEETTVRLDAARALSHWGADVATVAALIAEVETWADDEMLRCAATAGSESTAFAQKLARALGVRELARLTVSEAWARVARRGT